VNATSNNKHKLIRAIANWIVATTFVLEMTYIVSGGALHLTGSLWQQQISSTSTCMPRLSPYRKDNSHHKRTSFVFQSKLQKLLDKHKIELVQDRKPYSKNQ